jgi:hypothetical protein
MHRKMWFFLANFPNLVGGKMKVLKVQRIFLFGGKKRAQVVTLPMRKKNSKFAIFRE